MRITTDTPPTRVGRAGGRRVRHIPGIPSDALPPTGAVELPDEDEQELDVDDVATAPNPFDTDDELTETGQPPETDEPTTNASGRRLVTDGVADDPARIPNELRFGEAKFLSDIQLDRIGSALQDKRSLPTIDVRIVYRWKAKGGQRNGAPNRGGCIRLAGLAKHFADEQFGGDVDYVVWLAADHLRDDRYTNLQLEAELYHQLLHMRVEENEEGNLNKSVRPHDAELFLQEFQHYGAWRFDLQRVEDVVKVRQTSLF